MRRRLILTALVLACLAGAAAGPAMIGSGAERDAAAADRFVAVDGDDSRGCRSPADACASLDRAYRVAEPGEVVEVAAGEYPEQVIVADPAKDTSERVTIRPARGARVVVRGLTLGSDATGNGPRQLTVEGLRTAYASADRQLPAVVLPGSADVTLRNIDAGNFTVWGAQRIRIEGGDWGPCAIGPDAPCGNSKVDSGPEGLETDRITIDGARFHDYRFSPACFEEGADCHFECMYLNGSSNVTVSRSSFRDCALFDIFVTLSGPDAARVGHHKLKIVGNVLQTPWDEHPGGARRSRGGTALALNWCQNAERGYDDVVIAHNTFLGGAGIMNDLVPECRVENVKVVGNVLSFQGCDERWSYGYNVWAKGAGRGRCASTDREGARPVRDLVPVGAGPCPRTDIDGAARPRTGRCDAGARELG